MISAGIYVGTYKKYNEGSLKGEWIDLTEFSSKEDFYEEIKELHSDEEDPEFMFQDFEDAANGFYEMGWISESHIEEDVFECLNHNWSNDDELETFID